jgi:hypothetical protein
VLSPTSVLISASGLPRLELSHIDLQRRADPATTGSEVVALQVHNGALVLDDVTIGTDGTDQTVSVQRGVNLCLAELYARSLSVAADTIAVQGLAARVMISGGTAPSVLNLARYGMLMSDTSQVRLDRVNINAGMPVLLRKAHLEGQSVALGSGGPGPMLSGLQLERASTASLTISTIKGFRCAASAVDADSAVTISLPGNDIDRDNTNRACGLGKLSLIE